MSLYIQIGFGILILASFVIAFFSARTWHWGHVLVVLGIFLSTLGFFVLAAETLRINAVYRTDINRKQKELDDVNARNAALENGTDDANIIAQLRNEEVLIPEQAQSIDSLADLEHEILLETRARGRVWWNVAPAGINPQTGAVEVGVAAPVPAGVPADTVVFLFEQGEPQLPAPDGTPRGAQYLGEFRVAASAAQQATLQPVLPLDNFEQQRLAASRGPWIMYEIMPADRYKIFAGMSEDELKQKLPPQSVNEYLRHGKEAGPDDDEWHRAGFDESGKRLPPDKLGEATKTLYQRRLRDYALEFDELARRRVVLLVDIAGVQKDNERLNAALDSAKKMQTFREEEIQKLNTDLAGITKERQAIERHLAQVQQQLGMAQKLLAETLRRNSEMAKELAARQTGSLEPPGGALSPTEPAGPLALGSVN